MPISNKNITPVILGIDPGTKRIGYGVIKICGRTPEYVEAGLLIPRVTGIVPKDILFKKIYGAITKLIKTYPIDLIAIERVYFGRNISSAFAVSEVRGALSFMVQGANINAIDVHPTNVKQVVCGYGHADKTAVRKMTFRTIMNIPKSLTSRDAIDALAIALTGYYTNRSQKLIDKHRNSVTTDTG